MQKPPVVIESGCLLDQFPLAAVTTPTSTLAADLGQRDCFVIDASPLRRGNSEVLVHLVLDRKLQFSFSLAVDSKDDPSAVLRRKLSAMAMLPQPGVEHLDILWCVANEELDHIPIVVHQSHAATKLTTALDEILAFLLMFVSFGSDAKALAVTLWIAHTWVTDLFRFTPYLYVCSPTPRCGKTRLLECLSALSKNPWRVVAPTEAVLLRKITSDSPTLMIDETDALFRGPGDRTKETLRAMLNAGYERGGTIPRCSSDGIIEYPVYCPKALAGIGRLPQTVGDRSVRILLDRKARHEVVQPYRDSIVRPLAEPLVDLLAEWSADSDVRKELREARPFVPEELSDRAADICEPLLALAEFAGEPWVTMAREALTSLFFESNADHEDLAVTLLEALKSIFTQSGQQQLPTLHILQHLVSRDREPWATMWARDLTAGNVRGPAAKLAAFLHPFGIAAQTIRVAGSNNTPKGYKLIDFEQVFQRYLP